MIRLMALTFLLLGWALYEASGGARFAPPEAVPTPRIAYVAPPSETIVEAMASAPIAAPAQAAGYEPVRTVTTPPEIEEPEFTGPAPIDPPLEMRVVVASRLNMRSGPGTQHGVVTSLPRGTATEVLETDGRWTRVRAEGHEGWMATNLLAEAG